MKRLLIKLVKYMMIPVGAVRSLFRPAGPVRILMYHRVNDEVGKEISVTRADFCWQMAYLRRKGYEVISLDRALELPRAAGSQKNRYAVLTFDDGYEDFMDNAYPVLREYGYSATVYLVPGAVEADGVFWWDRDLGQSRLMSWEQIATLANDPRMEPGCHTLTHPDLDGLDEERTWLELSRSRDILRQRLGREIRHFAYPRGIMTRQARESCRKLYRSAVTIFDGNEINAPNPDPMMIKRLPIQRSDGRLLFGPRLRGWLIGEEWLKKLAGRH